MNKCALSSPEGWDCGPLFLSTASNCMAYCKTAVSSGLTSRRAVVVVGWMRGWEAKTGNYQITIKVANLNPDNYFSLRLINHTFYML